MINESNESIGKRIELEKIRLNLKNSEVCSALDIHLSTYRNYETGKRDMPISLLVKLRAMGFDVMYILTGETLREWANDLDSVVRGDEKPSFGKRLLPNRDENRYDEVLEKLILVEDTLQRAGATSITDYTLKDIVQIALTIPSLK